MKKRGQNPQGLFGQGPNNLGTVGPMSLSKSLFASTALKNQILNKREIKLMIKILILKVPLKKKEEKKKKD